MAHRRRQRAPREFREVELDLAGLSHLGGAVGRLDEMVYFVAYGLPGERVVAKVVREHGSYARAETTEVRRRCEADRAAPACPYFGTCGGCAWQHARYERQLAKKAQTVRDQPARLGGSDAPPLRPVIGATEPYHYRNHVRL